MPNEIVGSSSENPVHREPSSVAGLITVLASAASVALALSAGQTWGELSEAPTALASFVLLTLGLQLVSIEIYGRGAYSFAGCGVLAIGIVFGPGAAMATGALMGFSNMIRRRSRLHRGIFDMAQLTLAAGGSAAAYHLLGSPGWPLAAQIGPAVAAGAVYLAINIGLLSLVWSLSEGTRAADVWRERFRWMTPYYIASGPLALALTIAYDKVGLTGLFAFGLPPAFMIISARQYLTRTRESVEQVRAVNTELSAANTALAARNDDLQALLEFAGGLSARAHDQAGLARYAEETLGDMAEGRVRIRPGTPLGGTILLSGGAAVGAIEVEPTAAGERWERLRDAILPQLATALESSVLVEKVRKTHLETIAALSRSMEAKDHYTGGHTERVSDVAVAVARRLGYTGTDLDAIEIGALLHDIGKIGIPEQILHKPGPLDEDEWKVMRQHPVISEHILSGVDLSPIVLQAARSSHERIDGTGYPDGLAGNEIPMPARIVLVADAFDALTSDRPYRTGRHVAAALAELRQHAGTQFCPTVMQALEEVYLEEPTVLGVGLVAVA